MLNVTNVEATESHLVEQANHAVCHGATAEAAYRNLLVLLSFLPSLHCPL